MASPILTTTIENWGSILKRRPETTLPYLRDEDPHIPARTWVKAPRILTQQSMFFLGQSKTANLPSIYHWKSRDFWGWWMKPVTLCDGSNLPSPTLTGWS